MKGFMLQTVVNCRLAAECVNFYLRLSPLLLFMSLNHDMSYLRVMKTCFKWNSSELISLNYHILPCTYWAKLTATVYCSLNMYMYGNSGMEACKHKFTLSVNPSVVHHSHRLFSPPGSTDTSSLLWQWVWTLIAKWQWSERLPVV